MADHNAVLNDEYQAYGAAQIQEELDRAAEEQQRRWEEEQAKIAAAEQAATLAQQQADMAEQVAQMVATPPPPPPEPPSLPPSPQALLQEMGRVGPGVGGGRISLPTSAQGGGFGRTPVMIEEGGDVPYTPPPEPEPMPSPEPAAPPARRQFSPFDHVVSPYAGELAGNDEFMAIVAAAMKAESQWNPRAVGDAGNSYGLFQMHTRGAGAGMTPEARMDPDTAARVMVPQFVAAYNRLKAQNPGMSGVELASLVAATVERPLDWENPNSAARNGYRAAYNQVMGGAGAGTQFAGARASGSVDAPRAFEGARAGGSVETPPAQPRGETFSLPASEWVTPEIPMPSSYRLPSNLSEQLAGIPSSRERAPSFEEMLAQSPAGAARDWAQANPTMQAVGEQVRTGIIPEQYHGEVPGRLADMTATPFAEEYRLAIEAGLIPPEVQQWNEERRLNLPGVTAITGQPFSLTPADVVTGALDIAWPLPGSVASRAGRVGEREVLEEASRAVAAAARASQPGFRQQLGAAGRMIENYGGYGGAGPPVDPWDMAHLRGLSLDERQAAAEAIKRSGTPNADLRPGMHPFDNPGLELVEVRGGGTLEVRRARGAPLTPPEIEQVQEWAVNRGGMVSSTGSRGAAVAYIPYRQPTPITYMHGAQPKAAPSIDEMQSEIARWESEIAADPGNPGNSRIRQAIEEYRAQIGSASSPSAPIPPTALLDSPHSASGLPFPHAPGGGPPTPPRPPAPPSGGGGPSSDDAMRRISAGLPPSPQEVASMQRTAQEFGERVSWPTGEQMRLPGEDILRAEIAAMTNPQQPLPLIPAGLEKLVPNLKHIGVDDPIFQNFLIRNAERNPEMMQAAQGGRVPWEETKRRAGIIAETWTEQDYMHSPLARLDQDTITALRMTLEARGDMAQAMTRSIAERGGLDQLSPLEKVAAIKQIADLGSLQAVAIGEKSTLGRAMNALKIDIRKSMVTLGQGGESRADIEKLVQGNADIGRALGRLNGHGSPQDVAGAVDEARGALERYWELRRPPGAGGAPGPVKPTTPPPPWAAGHAGSPPFFSDFGKPGDVIADYLKQIDDWIAEGKIDLTTAKPMVRKKLQEVDTTDLKKALQSLKDTNDITDWDWERRFAEAEKRDKAQQQVAMKLLEKWTGGKMEMTDDLLKEFIDVMNSGDTLAALRFVRGVTDPGWWGAWQTLRYQSMLSAGSTHALQLVSNMANLGTNMASHILMAGYETATVRNPAQRATSFAETVPLVKGIGLGAHSSFPEALDILRYGATPDQMLRLDVPTGFGAQHKTIAGHKLFPGYTPESVLGRKIPTTSTANVVDAAMEAPLRLLAAGDWLVRGMANEGRMAQLATRKAISEGLTGPAVAERALQIMQTRDMFPALTKDADEFAKHTVFQEKNAFAAMVMGGNTQSKILSQFIPFVKTPLNVNWQGLSEINPLGLMRLPRAQAEYAKAAGARQSAELASEAMAGAAREFPGVVASRPITDPAIPGRGLADLRFSETMAKEKRDEVVAKAMLGTALVALGYWLTDIGVLTGPMPLNEGDRNANPEGWLPWAANTAGHYVGYASAAPWSVPVAMGWAMRSVVKQTGEVDFGALVAVGDMVAQQSFMETLRRYLEAIRDPNRRAEPIVEGFAQQVAPYGALTRQMERAIGMPPRDPHGPLDAIQGSLPFVAGNVQPKLNAVGQPDTSQVSGPYALVAPLRTTRMNDPKWRQELRRLDVPFGGIDKPKDMSVADHSRYKEVAGQLTAKRLNDTVESSTYENPGLGDWRRDDLRRKEMLEHAITTARADARRQLGIRAYTESSLGERWERISVPEFDHISTEELLWAAREMDRLRSGQVPDSAWPSPERLDYIADLADLKRQLLYENPEYRDLQQDRTRTYREIESYGR